MVSSDLGVCVDHESCGTISTNRQITASEVLVRGYWVLYFGLDRYPMRGDVNMLEKLS